MRNKNLLTGLVIGYGSVGRRHAEAIEDFCGSLVIVDTNAASRSLACQRHPEAYVKGSLEELDEAGHPWPDTLAVIATWGPSHGHIFHQLVDRGVKHILCEKPFACSIAHAECMARRAQEESVALAVHHFVRYTRLAPALRKFAEDHSLGDPVALQATGGAACLATNGIHWIDFASEIFGASPERVISTSYGEYINPRSSDLLLVGGTAVWSFDGGREAIIALTNRSSLALTVRVLFPDALVETDADAAHVVIRRRDHESVARYPAVTRTGRATELLFEGALPGMRTYPEAMRAALEEVASGRVDISPALSGVQAVSSVIGALLASRERRSIDLPLVPHSAFGRETWPIS
jgi:predicted dehydrogenase